MDNTGGDQQGQGPVLSLVLYVLPAAPSSVAAERALRAAVAAEGITAELEIVDVFNSPQRALLDGVFVTPTAIRKEPPPRVVVVGDLSRPQALEKLLSRA